MSTYAPLDQEIKQLCQRYQARLLTVDEQTVTIAVTGDAAPALLTALKFASNRRIVVERWSQAKLEQAFHPVPQVAESDAVFSVTPTTEPTDEETSVIHYINQTLAQAFQRRASDIHFEPMADNYRVRMRIDGVLHICSSPPLDWAARLTARLKIMGQLDIAERRLPQDGQFSFALDTQSLSLRIATLPVLEGEKVVLRVLQTYQQMLTLDNLGLAPTAYACLTQALQQPQGMILVTGPTGSGKTVTLYSAICWLNKSQRNICSVEDPVEIPLPGINQTALNLKAELDFSRILRALLRQDPDVVMIGEIRDSETAEIAVKAAQTGHLVLSTLHTNSAIETLTRLGHLGIPGYLLAGALTLLVAQRLVRRLCPHCKTPASSPLTFPDTLWASPVPHWEAQGCEHCVKGYYGRLALYELLPLTPALRHALSRGASTQDLAVLANETGYDTLFIAALQRVSQGETSAAEMYRVIGASSHSH